MELAKLTGLPIYAFFTDLDNFPQPGGVSWRRRISFHARWNRLLMINQIESDVMERINRLDPCPEGVLVCSCVKFLFGRHPLCLCRRAALGHQSPRLRVENYAGLRLHGVSTWRIVQCKPSPSHPELTEPCSVNPIFPTHLSV